MIFSLHMKYVTPKMSKTCYLKTYRAKTFNKIIFIFCLITVDLVAYILEKH